MDKKLTKYITSFDAIQKCTKYELIPDGGMIVLVNQSLECEVSIEDNTYKIGAFKTVLINAYEFSIELLSEESLQLTAIRFKGAGASFFYEDLMPELMEKPLKPIFIKENNLEGELDAYLKNRFKASSLPFNIMKVIDLLNEQGSDYKIDDILAIANTPRKVFDKIFNLRTGLTFKTYASVKEDSLRR